MDTSVPHDPLQLLGVLKLYGGTMSTGSNVYSDLDFVHKWSTEETKLFIILRAENEHLFTGKRNASKQAWATVIKEINLEGKITGQQAAKKWENLKEYKELKCPPTGTETESGEATAASWPFFIPMDEAIGGRPSIAPPVLIASSTQDEVAGPSTETSPPAVRKKRKSKGCVLDFLVAKAAREEEREKAAAERSERFLSLFEKLVNKM
ncbi:uncharacterized protein LOC125268186 [Megalobrama amblycephala]|uniref:uncharacterized protein LOC125268186 n=1 Tax=Megalobrama amblycephala TaxID=75352 RepID=UPI0020143854|nr:uncharacterized protein LOC125268186 [Megalobrama amblycephala]